MGEEDRCQVKSGQQGEVSCNQNIDLWLQQDVDSLLGISIKRCSRRQVKKRAWFRELKREWEGRDSDGHGRQEICSMGSQ